MKCIGCAQIGYYRITDFTLCEDCIYFNEREKCKHMLKINEYKKIYVEEDEDY